MRASHLACVSLLATAWLLPGCGAKTGLDVPDANIDTGRSRDAGIDADIGPHDGGRPSDRDMGDRDMGGTDANIPCIQLDPDAGPLELPLDTQVELTRADVVFLIDHTGSMSEEIGHIQAELRDVIAPGIQAAIPDAQIGVAMFADFPVFDCGVASDHPYDLVLPVTGDLALVQSAVNGISVANGGDQPEAQVEALYQTVTGEGLGSYIPASFGCASGGTGFACFRGDALPVILLFTDDLWHNGPGNSDPYTNDCPSLVTELASLSPPQAPRPYTDAVTVLNARGVRVISIFSGENPAARDHMLRIARDTRALDAAGAPIEFDIGTRGESLSASVVSAITILSSVVRFDIDAVLVNPNPGSSVDPRVFVQSIRPLRAEPMDGIASIDLAANVFRQVRTGTRVVFQLTLRNGSVAPGVGPQTFPLEIVFRGDMRTRLGSTIINIVIPGADGTGCIR